MKIAVPSSLYRELNKFRVFGCFSFHTVLLLLPFLAMPFFLYPFLSHISKIALASSFCAGSFNESDLWQVGKTKEIRGFNLEFARLAGEQVHSLKFKILFYSFLPFSVEYYWMGWRQSIFWSSDILLID